jgi:hypothetical protein
MKIFWMKYSQKIYLGLIFLILFLIPFFWTITIGGDDGRFYYVFPLAFLKNFVLGNISPNDLGSFSPQQYMTPFVFLLFLFQKIAPFLNIQRLFLGLNLSCSFLFFYLFLGFFGGDEDATAKITAALFYSLSIFSYYTLWSSQLLPMYLISIFPLILYLFFKSVRENKIVYSILGSLILSIFLVVISSVPWLMALVIAALPLIINFFWNNKKIFIKCFIIFMALCFLLNVYWLIGFILSSSNGGIVGYVTSAGFKEQNISLIESVSSHNSVLYPLFDLFHKNIQIDFGWPSKDLYLNYLLKLLPLNLLFLIAIILPIFFYKKVSRKNKEIYNLALLSWLIILFLFTANIGEWGIPLFVWLTTHIPGFVMFRNMYDKFGIALAFSYAFFLFISLKIIFNDFKIKNFQKYIITSVLILLILLNGCPFLFGEFFKSPIWTTQNTYARINEFNDDFYSLTDYIAKINTSSKFLWLPLNQAGYIEVSDKYNSNYYYSGVSLLKTLSGKSDYSGTPDFDGFSGNMGTYIDQKNYGEIFSLLGTFDIQYIILNNDISKELQDSYLYSTLSTSDFYSNQMNPDFLNGILGEKVADFGSRYSLYKINDKYASKTLNLGDANIATTTTRSIEFKKTNDNQYQIYIKGLATSTSLTFLSSYSKFWDLYLQPNPNDAWCQSSAMASSSNNIECQNEQQSSGGMGLSYLYAKPIFDSSHYLVDDYANGWTIDPNYIKQNFDPSYYKVNSDGSIDIELTLYFKPQSYFYVGVIVSGTTLLACLGYLGWDFAKRRKEKREMLEAEVFSGSGID